MKTLKSYVLDDWHTADSDFAPLVDPSIEEQIGQISSSGIDFARVLDHARTVGGPALREMTFAERGALLKEMSKVLRDNREELLELSRVNNGTTVPDGSFDVDGASGTLAYYAAVSRSLGERQSIVEGEEIQLSKEGGFRAGHLWVPRQGVAVHVNAFNFPAWGFAEKAACALLAGLPVITKPASATALVTERCVELLIEAQVLPAGALQLICGSTGDLIDRLGGQDVLAFTGSADTAARLRHRTEARLVSARMNVEADSLNAAVVAPDVDVAGATFDLFIKEVCREITQKAGQKCTAVRRILAPQKSIDVVEEALFARLGRVVTGNPANEGVTMGPLATAGQLADALEGVRALGEQARRLLGTGKRVDGQGSPTGKGYFLSPMLFRAQDPLAADRVHQREVFAPVATLMPYDGSVADAAAIVALGGGTLVTSLYSDDVDWSRDFIAQAGPQTGRLYVGSAESVGQTPGSGAALPQTLHGGPGRAGGGEELGGLVGVRLYMQRLAVQGGPTLIRSLSF